MDRYYSYEFQVKARTFLLEIISHYQGSAEHKLEKSKEFLDDLLFKVQSELDNPFSNDSRNMYDVVIFSRIILLPKMLQELENIKNSDPFIIHEWH